MRKQLKTAALLFVAAATFALPFAAKTGGTAFQYPEQIVAHADESTYSKAGVDLAAATAFDDARSAIKKATGDEATEMENNFNNTVGTLTSGTHWGNVGLFVGPKGKSSNSDIMTTLSKISIDTDQITKYYDPLTDDRAFSKYKAFGGAVQKLNTRAQKTKGSSNSIQKGLDQLSSAGAKLTNLGVNLLKDYNPAPVILSFIDPTELNRNPDNKLVAMVNGNTNLKEIINVIGMPTSFGVPMCFLIMALIAMLLLVTSVLMTLINGRAAGENIRKMVVKIVIGSVAVPLIAKGMQFGVNFLGTSAATVASSPESTYVEQNLNLADWYACGFALPSGVTIEINKKGAFVFQPEDVRKINEFTYTKLWGTPTDEKMMEKMEEYYNLLKAFPMQVGFSEPIKDSGKPWKTDVFYATLENFGTGKPLTEGIDVDPAGSNPAMGNVGYYMTNGLTMSGSDGAWSISGSGSKYGVSPIAATNIMRTAFTGSAMTVNSNSTMGGVVFDVDNGTGTGTAHMSSLTRFLATLAMVMAAMKGLFTVFAAGFGGIFSGGVKSAMGSSSGFGQALGGILALVGGIFGISIIMTMSYTLLDQMYGVMESLLSGTTAGADILDPFKEVVEDIPILGPILGDAMKSVARFVLTTFCALTLPKFGGIPVTLFCQYMAELPHQMAERAQQIENKFTGDFRGGSVGRGGGGGMSSAGSLANQAVNSGVSQGKGMLTGASMALGALGGLALNKWGNHLDKKADKLEGAESMNAAEGAGSDANPENVDPESLQDADTAAAAAEAADNEEEKKDTDNDRDEGESNAPENGSLVNNENVEGNGLKESEKENLSSYDEGDSMSDSYAEDSSDVEQDSTDGYSSDEYGSESSMSDTDSEESSYGEQNTDNLEASSDSSMSDIASESSDSVDNEGFASISAEQDTTVEADSSASMNSGDGDRAEAGLSSSATEGSERASAGGHPSMNGERSSSGGSSDKRELTAEQKRARRMHAVAAGLKAAGGHTTGAQAAAGVAAGLTHMAGSRVGAQSVTAKGVNAVRNQRERANDIRQGLPANYSRTQRRQNEAGQAKKTPGSTPNAARPTNARNTNARQQQFANALAREAEERAREAEEQTARRRQQRQ